MRDDTAKENGRYEKISDTVYRLSSGREKPVNIDAGGIDGDKEDFAEACLKQYLLISSINSSPSPPWMDKVPQAKKSKARIYIPGYKREENEVFSIVWSNGKNESRDFEDAPACEIVEYLERTTGLELSPQEIADIITESEKKALRKKKEPPVQPKKKGRHGWFFILISILLLSAAFCAGLVIWGHYDEKSFKVTFYEERSSKINEPFRIVQLSDLHLHEYGKDNSELIERIKELKPDIICMTGDMMTDSVPDYSTVTDLCDALKDIAPIYYSLGNNEVNAKYNLDSGLIVDLKKEGVHVLNDSMESLTLNGNQITIAGNSEGAEQFFKYGGDKVVEKLSSAGGYRILLNHFPDLFLSSIKDNTIDLSLCGHTHGGLVRIPIIGTLYAQNQGLFPKLAEGQHKVGSGSVIISRGLGNDHFIPRINDKPELVVIDAGP